MELNKATFFRWYFCIETNRKSWCRNMWKHAKKFLKIQNDLKFVPMDPGFRVHPSPQSLIIIASATVFIKIQNKYKMASSTIVGSGVLGRGISSKISKTVVTRPYFFLIFLLVWDFQSLAKLLWKVTFLKPYFLSFVLKNMLLRYSVFPYFFKNQLLRRFFKNILVLTLTEICQIKMWIRE